MSIANKNLRGGGLNKGKTTTSKALFIPLIASSLAMFLHAQAGAGDSTIGQDNANVPTLVITEEDMSKNKITASGNLWNSDNTNLHKDGITGPENHGTQSINWTLSNNIFSPTITSNEAGKELSDHSLSRLTITFSPIDLQDSVWVWTENNANTGNQQTGFATITGSTTASKISVDFKNKGLSLADGVLKSFTLDFGSKAGQVSKNKTIEIKNLASLNADLRILTGTGPNAFIVDIGEMTGNITFNGGNPDDSEGRSVITIEKQLTGDIFVATDLGQSDSQQRGVQFQFQDEAKMVGSVREKKSIFNGLKRTLTFGTSKAESEVVVLKGNVFSYGSTSHDGIDKNGGNHITFNQGNMQGSFISTQGDKNASRKGYNNITFASGVSQTLQGGILADDNQKGVSSGNDDNQATNTLNLSDNTTLSMQQTENNAISDNDRNFSLTTGSIVARNYGINEINLGTSSTLNLNNEAGEIITEGSNNAISKINFNGTNGTLQGNITTNAGTATITVVDSASGTIKGNITGSGRNNIVFGVAQGSLRGVQAQPLAPTAPSLTLQGATSTITSITANNAGTLILDGANGATPSEGEPSVKATIGTVTGDLTAQFNGTESNGTQLVMSQGGQTIKTLAFGTDSTNNKLTLSAGTTTIADQVTLAQNQGITFDLANNTELALTAGSDSRLVSETKGAITLTVADNATGTLSGGEANITNLDFSGSASQTLKLKSGTANFGTITANNETGSNLIIDGANATGKVSASVNAISGDHLTVNLNGADSKGAELTIKGGVNTIASLTLGDNGSGATKANKLIVAGGNTGVGNALSVASDQEVEFEIKTGASLAFTNGLSNAGGVINIKGEGTAGSISQTTLSSNITTSSGTTNLYFKDALWIPISSFTADQQVTSGKVEVTGGKSNIAVDLTNGSGLSGRAIYDVVTTGGENNILVKGTTNIGAQVTYGKTGETNLMFVSGSSGNVNFTTSTDITTPENGISMFGINFTNGVILTLQDKDVATKGGNMSFLSLAGKDSASPAFGFTTSRDTSTNTDTVDLHGVAVGSIKAIGSTNTQDPSTPTDHTYNVVLNKDAIFAGTVALYGENQIINLDMKEASKLFANNSALHIENLKIESTGLDTSDILGNSFTQNNVVIDLATDGNSFENISRDISANGYRVLVIGSRSDAGQPALPYVTTPTGLTGDNGLFRVYVDTATKGELGKGVSGMNTAFKDANAHSDRIFVNEGSGKHYIQAIYKQGTDLNTISYHDGGVETEGNIAVATVASTAGVTFEGASQVQGFDVIGTHLTEGIATDSQGQYNASGAYKTYFIKSATTDGIANSATQTTTSALGINYDLFLANFNSLNKRMGELRDNNNGQGAWARVFVGGLSTSYGLETQSTYTTIQAGYDYAFGFEGANNYLGVALSYANALTDTKKSIDVAGVVSGIDKTSTNGIEVALYNSYVEDSGWFNDTIFKFSYMVSDVKVLNQADTYNTNNFGIVLSDEFGYRFKLGESKEWYIDPQLEVGFGYFNQSDLKQVLGQATLTGIQDAIVTLRARVGANWAYDFKNFTQGKGISASVYLGTYYSYDYISGGEINLVTDLGTKGKLTPLSSTGRFELNVGTNIGVYDNTRIYFDFEKSFGGDITTDYQVNLGVRYSFGESNGYTPAIKTEVAPLKVSDEKPQEQSAQESVSSEEKAQ